MKRSRRGNADARRGKGWSRREFLAGTTAAGLAVGLPPWLVGCGEDEVQQPASSPAPTPTPGSRPTEEISLQFDFSYADIENPRLHIFGSQDDLIPLQKQTAASRNHFREENPLLAAVPDQDLTHFAEDVELPADALQIFWVTGTSQSGEEALAGFNISVPTPMLAAAARRAQARGRLVPSAKMRYYGLALSEEDLPEVHNAIASFVTPFDTATALVFQQAEILNLNPDQGAMILQMIQTLPCVAGDATCEPFIGTLAFRIASAWPATMSGFTTVGGQQVAAWAKLVPVFDPDGRPVLDSQGKQALSYDVRDDIGQTALSVAKNIRKFIFDDPDFEGNNWHSTKGLTTETTNESTRSASRSRVAVPAVSADPPLQVVGEHGQGTNVNGVEFTTIGVTNAAQRSVEVVLRNHFIRFMSAYVQFANEAGDLPLTNPGKSDTPRSRFLQLLNPNYTVFGIPLLGESVEKQTLRFDIPTGATKARIYFGSLGVGGEAFSPEAVVGSVATLGFNIGLPTVLLAAGAAAGGALQKSVTGFLASPGGRTAITLMVTRAIALAGPAVANGIFGIKNSGNATPLLASLGSALVSVITSADEFSALAITIGLAFLSNRIGDFALPLSWAFKAAALAADVSTLVQTVTEVLSTPAIFTNTLSLQMTTTVTINKDPDNSTFPVRATQYKVILTYDQASKLAHEATGAITAGRDEPIVVTFDKVPSGGQVTIDVILKTDDDWIVGRSTGADGQVGPYGPISNTPATSGAVSITLKELLIPLTKDTQYKHTRKVAYQTGAHVWVPGGGEIAPTATRANLCQGQDNQLCNLVGITVSQRTGMLGYGFQAGGQGVSFCGQASGGVMYVVQNLAIADGRDRALKQSPCGFPQPSGIVYDRLGPADGSGRNFFIQPTSDGFFLQSILLDQSTPINVNNPLSWGRFSEPMDALALHPMGYVVGVNRNNHKMEILQLPPAPVNGADAPDAIPFAVQKSGEGARAGLMRVPVAVTVFDGAILVLETGNARVQAFDVSANPVNLFKNKTQSTFDLVDSLGTYTDLGVDGLGYMYVLSFVDSGAMLGNYRLDIYTPQGDFLTRTVGVAAGRMAVDTFRSVYTLNFETLMGSPRIEPSLSQWVPVTPMT